MALGFSLLSDYRNGGCRGFDYNGFWSFSLALALGMQIFAQRTRSAAADELFSLGLLLRVGELALATLYPEEYDKVLERSRATVDADLMELEREAFAMTHAELGFAMLSDWGLPAVFVDLVRFYECPEKSGYTEGGRPYVLLQSLIGARSFAEMCFAGETEQSWLIRRFLAQAERLGLDRDELFADCRRMHKLWVEWGELLKLVMPPGGRLSGVDSGRCGRRSDGRLCGGPPTGIRGRPRRPQVPPASRRDRPRLDPPPGGGSGSSGACPDHRCNS
jgi:two-component system, cell cycle response regulator